MNEHAPLALYKTMVPLPKSVFIDDITDRILIGVLISRRLTLEGKESLG